MNRLFLCILFLAATICHGANLVVNTSDLVGQSVTNKKVAISMVSSPSTSGTSLVVPIPLRGTTDVAGSCVFTNMVSGTYLLSIDGPPVVQFRLFIPDTNGTLTAAACISVSVAANTTQEVLTPSAGDARYVQWTNSGNNTIEFNGVQLNVRTNVAGLFFPGFAPVPYHGIYVNAGQAKLNDKYGDYGSFVWLSDPTDMKRFVRLGEFIFASNAIMSRMVMSSNGEMSTNVAMINVEQTWSSVQRFNGGMSFDADGNLGIGMDEGYMYFGSVYAPAMLLTESFRELRDSNNVTGDFSDFNSTNASTLIRLGRVQSMIDQALSGGGGGGGSAATNGLATTNYVNAATNGFVTGSVTNGLATTGYVNAATNGFVGSAVTNGLATTNYVNAATNGFVTVSVTNGLATTGYVNTATNGFVGGAVTNGLATTNYVNAATNGFVTGSVTNGLATTGYVNAATNGFVGSSVTNGLATTNYVNARLSGLGTVTLIDTVTGTTNILTVENGRLTITPQ